MVNSKQVLQELENRLKKSLEATSYEFTGIRAGYASPALLERIKVEYYGAVLPLNQVASILVPEPRTLLVKPWDKNILKDIERTIAKSDLGISPINLGDSLKIIIPPLSEERRLALVKIINKKAEEGKVAMRNIRREAIEELSKKEKAGELPEDEFYRLKEEVQKVVDRFIANLEELRADKEKEVMG